MTERLEQRSQPTGSPFNEERRVFSRQMFAFGLTVVLAPQLIGAETPSPEASEDFANWRYEPVVEKAQYDGVWRNVVNMVGVQRLSEIGVQHETPSVAAATRACEDPNIHMAEVDIRLTDEGLAVVQHTKWNRVKMTLTQFHECILPYDTDPKGKQIFVKYNLKGDHPHDSESRRQIAEYNTTLLKPSIINFSESKAVTISPFREEGKFWLPIMAREMHEQFPGSILSTGTDLALDEEVINNISELNTQLDGRFTFPIEIRDCARQWEQVKRLTEEEGVVVTVYDLTWKGSPKHKRVIIDKLNPERIIPDIK